MIAIGVVVVGRLFGFVGLFVAVPILSLITICVQSSGSRSSMSSTASRNARTSSFPPAPTR